MPSSTPTHDLVILGGGSGGYAAALRARMPGAGHAVAPTAP